MNKATKDLCDELGAIDIYAGGYSNPVIVFPSLEAAQAVTNSQPDDEWTRKKLTVHSTEEGRFLITPNTKHPLSYRVLRALDETQE